MSERVYRARYSVTWRDLRFLPSMRIQQSARAGGISMGRVLRISILGADTQHQEVT